MIRHDLLKKENREEERDKLSKFPASNGWVDDFVKRHGITSNSLHSQEASAPVAEAAQCIDELCKNQQEFDTESICNLDQTGLFYRLIPRRTYVIKHEARRHFIVSRQ